MAGHFFKFPHPSPQAFPDEPLFQGFLTPNRVEADISNLHIEGKIPPELDGTFYRVIPDPAQPPFIKNDVWFNGDGLISAFRIKNGVVDWKTRYVQTEKLVREREARRALLGKYRNKYTDAVEFTIRTSANTNIIYHNGVLLACKEDGPPYAMDPVTLETLGPWNFHGQMQSLTFTAHPRVDPETKEMFCFGYEAKGDGTHDICYWVVDPKGKVTETVWLKSPYCGMIHDLGLTKNYAIFAMIPLICDVERMKAGGEHFAFDPKEPIYFGVLPRYGAKGSDAKWFKGDNAFLGHLCNAYENAEGHIEIDIIYGENNVFIFWPDTEGRFGKREDQVTSYRRFTFDPKSNNMDLPPPKMLGDFNSEFPRFDERYNGRKQNDTFMNVMIPSETDWPAIEKKMGYGFPLHNHLSHYNDATGEWKHFSVGKTSMVQEPIFIPRTPDSKEGDGYVIALVNRYETFSTDLIVMDTQDWTKPVATVKLPCKLRPGIHGNWVDSSEMAETSVPKILPN